MYPTYGGGTPGHGTYGVPPAGYASSPGYGVPPAAAYVPPTTSMPPSYSTQVPAPVYPGGYYGLNSGYGAYPPPISVTGASVPGVSAPGVSIPCAPIPGAPVPGTSATGSERGGRSRGNRGGEKNKRTGVADKRKDKDKVMTENETLSGTSSAPSCRLIVTGCQHGTVGNIVRGEFTQTAENHGKPVYKKDVQVNSLDVMLYFWDERDGANFCGWWFGPKVGGDQVWAYHPDKVSTPPGSGWKVPYDGPVDETFRVTLRNPVQPELSKPEAADSAVIKTSEEKQKNKQEESQRFEEEKNRKHAEEQKKQVEAMRRREEEEKRKRLEQQTKAQEDAKRVVEDECKRKEEESRKKKEVEEKRRQEQKSTLAIRRVIQKVRSAAPETFLALQQELKEVLAAELDNTGSQKQRMTEESDKGLEQARARIEQINLARRKEQEKKENENRKKKETEIHAQKLVQDLTGLVDTAEEAAKQLQDVANPFEANTDLSVADVERIAETVETSGSDARMRTKACTDFILQRGSEMKETVPVASAEMSETKQALAKLLQRINDCTRLSETVILTARATKTTAVRRAAARDKAKEMEASFAKYDKDGDEYLSKKEVAEYAKGEYKFAVPEEAMTRIWRNMVEDGTKGVPLERFNWLRIVVGTAREKERDIKRKQEREEKEAVLNELKKELSDRIQDSIRTVDAADKEIMKVESRVQPLIGKVKNKVASEMAVLSREAADLIKEAKSAVEAAKHRINVLNEGMDERFKQDLQKFLAQEVKPTELRLGRMDSRIQRAQNICGRFKEQVVKQSIEDMEISKSKVLKVARYNRRLHGWSNEEFFEAFDRTRDGEIDKDDFVYFFKSAEKEIRDLDFRGKVPAGKQVIERAPADELAAEASKTCSSDATSLAQQRLDVSEKPILELVDLPTAMVEKIFASVVDESATSLSRDCFARFSRHCLKVVRETAITDCSDISKSRTIRRIEPMEVVEVLEGPLREESAGVLRIRCKALNDDQEGWVTVAGNQGTVFLSEGGSLFKVVKEMILTESFNIAPDKDANKKSKETTRKVEEGEVLEVWEWPRKEETSGLTRMRCRVRSNGAIGWLTTTGNQGAVFAELI